MCVKPKRRSDFTRSAIIITRENNSEIIKQALMKIRSDSCGTKIPRFDCATAAARSPAKSNLKLNNSNRNSKAAGYAYRRDGDTHARGAPKSKSLSTWL